MAEAEQDKFSCRSCGRKYLWKPDLAGRKVKCKCGTIIQVPAGVGAAAPVGNPLDDELYATKDDPPPPVAKRAAPPAAAPAPARAPVAKAASAPAKDAGYRCPGCSQPVTPGAVICVNCGFNFKTGKKMSTGVGGPEPAAPVAAAPAPARGGGGGGKSAAAPPAEEKRSGLQGPLMAVGLVILVAALLGGLIMIRTGGGGSSGGKAAASNLDEDVKVVQMMKDDGATEAKEWLEANKRHQVMGMANHTAIKYIDDFYKMGAKKVFAFGEVVTATLALELPEDPAKRAEIFAWQERWHTEMFEKVHKDEGQKYLLIRMRM